MKRRINPNQIMLGMMPKACSECKHIQHVFFTSQESFDTWDCPVCKGRLEDGDNPKPEIES
jgi:hypothetical protein